MRAELSRQRSSYNAEESTTRRAKNGWWSGREQDGVAKDGGGWYVKGGRARCYLACSPDEISASSFRPSSPLLPRSFPPSLPSSYAFFLFCFCLPYTLSPAGSSVMPLRGEKFFRARHCQTFDCVGISLFLSCFSFSSYLNLFFFFFTAFLLPYLFVFFIHLF